MADPLHRRLLNREIDGVLVAFEQREARYLILLRGTLTVRSCNPEYVWRVTELMRSSYRLGEVSASLDQDDVCLSEPGAEATGRSKPHAQARGRSGGISNGE
jgi:hypothetical protein